MKAFWVLASALLVAGAVGAAPARSAAHCSAALPPAPAGLPASVVVTTNRSFKEWNQVFPYASCIATMLDRLLRHADVTVIEGESYRVRERQREAAARRRPK